ncbi:uncharacterized protein TNCV_1289551 [Trichonephila clavipes]|nr:uncharacterized protein TNCV_1289551 [Trichonephila clavipes]
MAFLIRSKKIDLIQLARDLDESPEPSMSKIVLRNLIISSKYYKEEEAKELLEVITAERLGTEQQQKLEQQEQLSIEKLCLEMELSRIANQSATQNNGQTSRVKSLDEIVKMAFASEMVSDELKPKVLLCMLGDKVSNLLVNLGEEELKDYESLKTEGTELVDGTVAARVDVLGKVIPRRAIEDKLSKLVKTSISVDGKSFHDLFEEGIFGPAVKCPLVYVSIGLATGGQVNVVHQQVLCALAEVFLVEDVLLPPEVLDMLGGASRVKRIHTGSKLSAPEG